VEAHRRTEGLLGASHYRGVIELVQEHDVPAAYEPRHDPQVRLVAGRKHQAGFLAEELSQLRFQLLMQIQGSVQEAAPRAARAVAIERGFRGAEHLRVMRESQV